jgi:hypothetical protein
MPDITLDALGNINIVWLVDEEIDAPGEDRTVKPTSGLIWEIFDGARSGLYCSPSRQRAG